MVAHTPSVTMVLFVVAEDDDNAYALTVRVPVVLDPEVTVVVPLFVTEKD